MEKPTFEAWPRPDESPALPGPDYVALVIEWEDVPEDLDDQVTDRVIAGSTMPMTKKVAAALGALGAFLVARWGFRRLRHA